LGDEPLEYYVVVGELKSYVDKLLETLKREPSRGDDLLFTYISNEFREVYERVYGKPPSLTPKDYVERGSIKIEDATNLLEGSFRSESDIILFEVSKYVLSFDVLSKYVNFIALLKED
jgi:hypothetical protein